MSSANTASIGHRGQIKKNPDAPVNTRPNINLGGHKKKPVTLPPVPWRK